MISLRLRRRAVGRRVAVALTGLLGLAGAVACGDNGAAAPPRPTAKTVATQPRAIDHYARLIRQQLNDPDPLGIEQAVVCESTRITTVLGPAEGQLRIADAEDSILSSPADYTKIHNFRASIGQRPYTGDGPVCAQFNELAARESPLQSPLEQSAPASAPAGASAARPAPAASAPPAR